MIFFAGSLDLNGGSTFLIRMARALASRGERIAVVVINDVRHEDVVLKLQEHADIFYPGDFVNPMFRALGGTQLCVTLPLHRAAIKRMVEKYGHVVHVMGVFGLVLAARWAAIQRCVRITAGVYHQNEFAFRSRRRFVRRIQAMFAKLPAANLVFFNEHNVNAYGEFFRRSYATARILPIGIEMPALPEPLPAVQRGRIVSIGNLENFKTYNEYVIRTIAEMAASPPELRYDIYGEGIERPRLEALIESLHLQDRVVLHGRIPYARFPDALGGAMAFVGSGTALLEAAATGVPSIVGVESMPGPQTYGFLFDIDGLSYNEQSTGARYVTFRSLFDRLLAEDDAGVRALGMRCRTKALEFSIDRTATGFLEMERSAEVTTTRVGAMHTIGYFWDVLCLAVAARVFGDDSFRHRRHQSAGRTV